MTAKITLDREQLAKVIHHTWGKWAEEQSLNKKPKHPVWDELRDSQKQFFYHMADEVAAALASINSTHGNQP